MHAAWWWIDRWRKSTAYTDMSAEEQGVYRNLLDELWIREGALPTSEKSLAKISGDFEAWPRVRKVVLARFYLADDGWRHTTHDEVMDQAIAFRKRQQEKGKKRASTAKRGPGGTFQPNQPETSRTSSRDTSRTVQPDDQPETSLPSPITNHLSPITESDHRAPSKTDSVPAEPVAPSRDNGIATVVDHYRTLHPRARPGKKERTLIAARLKDGYTPSDLIDAINGYHRSPFHLGENDGGKRYLALSLIVRDADHVRAGVETPIHGETPILSQKTTRNLRAASSWLLNEESKDAQHG